MALKIDTPTAKPNARFFRAKKYNTQLAKTKPIRILSIKSITSPTILFQISGGGLIIY